MSTNLRKTTSSQYYSFEDEIERHKLQLFRSIAFCLESFLYHSIHIGSNIIYLKKAYSCIKEYWSLKYFSKNYNKNLIYNFNMIQRSPLVCSIIIIASSWPFLFLYHDFYLLTYFVCSIEAQRFKPWNLQAQVQSSNKNDVEILIRFITTTIVACSAVCWKCVRVEMCAWVSQ